MGRKTAAIYCRTSRDDTDDPRLSIATQIEDGKTLAAKLGLKVTDERIYIDQNLSGKLPPTRWHEVKLTKANHRPGLEAAMVALESGEVQALIIRHRDRLCRSLKLSIKLFEFLSCIKAEVYATNDTIAVSHDATSSLQLNLLMAIAQYQLDSTQENVLRAKKKQKHEGLKMSPCFTLGYQDGKTKGTVTTEGNDEAVQTVRELYRRYLAGETVGELVRWLNTEKSHLYNTYGKAFYHSSVRRILTNPHYIGMVYNEQQELIKSQAYEAIIAADLFYRVQKAMRSRRNPKHGRKVAQHLLSGFLKCGKCGRPMNVYSRYHKTGKYRVGFEYKCRYVDCRSPKAFTMRENHWDTWLGAIGGAPFFVLTEDAIPADGQLTELYARLETLSRSRESLRKSIANGDRELADIRPLLADCDDSIAKLRSKIQVLEAAQQPLKSRDVPWEGSTFLQRRECAGAVIDSVMVFPDFALLFKHRDMTPWVFPLQRRHIEGCPSARPFNVLLPAGSRFEVRYYSMDISPCPSILERVFPQSTGKRPMMLVNHVPLADPQRGVPQPNYRPLVPLSLAKSVKRICSREYRFALRKDGTLGEAFHADGIRIKFRTA